MQFEDDDGDERWDHLREEQHTCAPCRKVKSARIRFYLPLKSTGTFQLSQAPRPARPEVRHVCTGLTPVSSSALTSILAVSSSARTARTSSWCSACDVRRVSTMRHVQEVQTAKPELPPYACGIIRTGARITRENVREQTRGERDMWGGFVSPCVRGFRCTRQLPID